MRLWKVVAHRWTVLAVCDESGACLLLEYLDRLSGRLRKDGDRMLALLEHVAREGPQRLSVEVSHQIEGDIWQFTKGDLRVLWFYDDNKLVVCCRVFEKRGQKTKTADKQVARGVLADYRAAKRAGRLEVVEDDEDEQT